MFRLHPLFKQIMNTQAVTRDSIVLFIWENKGLSERSIWKKKWCDNIKIWHMDAHLTISISLMCQCVFCVTS